MKIIDGKATAAAIKAEIAQEVAKQVALGRRAPHLVAVLVGHDGGSETYVANKVKACEACGFRSTVIRREDTVTEVEILELIDSLNHDDEVDGFIIQLPLPRHIDEQKVTRAVAPEKDVDGFNPANVGMMSLGLPCFKSATPAGIVELLKRYEVPTRGKHCVIIGRSNIVGKPLAMLMMQKGVDATVTVCHSATSNLAEITRSADILVAALGKPAFVTADMVKPGTTVIDVGTTRVPDASRKSGFRLSGDVDYEVVAPMCEYITPVPGGVGPMTIAMLMYNTLQAYLRR